MLPAATLGQEIDGSWGRQLEFSFCGLIFQDENSRTIGGGGRALPRQKIKDPIFLILAHTQRHTCLDAARVKC